MQYARYDAARIREDDIEELKSEPDMDGLNSEIDLDEYTT